MYSYFTFLIFVYTFFYYSGDNKQQEQIVETYLRLLTTGLEDEYFICDYNSKYPVENQNEVFESCSGLYPFYSISMYEKDKKISLVVKSRSILITDWISLFCILYCY